MNENEIENPYLTAYRKIFHNRNGGLKAGTSNDMELTGDIAINCVIKMLTELDLDEESRFIDIGTGLGHFPQIAFNLFNVSLSIGIEKNPIVVGQILNYLHGIVFGKNKEDGCRPNSTVMFMEGDLLEMKSLVL